MTAPDLPTSKYVVAPAPPGYRGTALWTVTADGELGEMVATEPQDHGPGSTAVADLEHALAVYRAACAVLAPDEATVHWLAKSIEALRGTVIDGRVANMPPRYMAVPIVRAALRALAGTSAQARHTANGAAGGA